MWTYIGNNIRMIEGDYGIGLPIIIKGAIFDDNDIIRITFKKTANDAPILEKEYTPIYNTIELKLTEAESALFPVGTYVYALDWYRDSVLLCNITPVAELRVFDKV